MANLHLSGSFSGVVFQEQVLNSLLQSKTIYSREVVWKSDPITGTALWQKGAQKVLVTGKPCTFYLYLKGDPGLSSPVHIGHDNLSSVNSATAKQNPTVVVFFAESQIFSSIDLTICIKSDGTGNSAAQKVDMYHSSVSVDAKHFARTSTATSAGHLPLKIDDNPPTLLRSDRSRKQVTAYCSTLLEHGWVTGCSVMHHYAVFGDSASDLLSHTPPFRD